MTKEEEVTARAEGPALQAITEVVDLKMTGVLRLEGRKAMTREEVLKEITVALLKEKRMTDADLIEGIAPTTDHAPIEIEEDHQTIVVRQNTVLKEKGHQTTLADQNLVLNEEDQATEMNAQEEDLTIAEADKALEGIGHFRDEEMIEAAILEVDRNKMIQVILG